MGDHSISAIHGRARSFTSLAFTLMVAGFGIAVAYWCFPRWPSAVSWAALGIEVLAFILALFAWPRRLAKITASATAVFFLLSLLVTFYGPTVQQEIRPSAPWMMPLETTWELQSPGKTYSVSTTSAVQRGGEDSLRFELRSGERWIDLAFQPSFRSEIAAREHPPVGSVIWYSFSVYFPDNFPIEANRLVFAQWHSPVDTFPDPGLIPPLSFHFETGNLKIKLRHSDESSLRDPESAPEERLFSKEFPSAQWHDFAVQAKWSWESDGFVNVWWNGDLVVEYRGPVGYRQKTGPQFKFGLYRDDTDQTYVAYFNQVKTGDTSQIVGFDTTTRP